METSILMQFTGEVQAFSGADGLAIFTLAILEGILSVDNSLALENVPREIVSYLINSGLLLSGKRNNKFKGFIVRTYA